MGLSAMLMGTGCASHYELASVKRTRILVDSRYDAAPDAAAAKFMETYKNRVESAMRPVLGEVIDDFTAHRTEGD